MTWRETATVRQPGEGHGARIHSNGGPVKKILAVTVILAAVAASPVATTLEAQQTTGTAGGTASGMSGMQGHNMKMSGWQELDRFHMVLMQTWHPIKDKADVEPTRRSMTVMKTVAEALTASTAPKGCDTPELEKARKTLTANVAALAKLVDSKADDKAITEAMKELHDNFEVLEEGCKPAK